MSRFKCLKCYYINPPFTLNPNNGENIFILSGCSGGTTWDCVKCPSCERYFYYPRNIFGVGFIPEDIIEDDKHIKLKDMSEILIDL